MHPAPGMRSKAAQRRHALSKRLPLAEAHTVSSRGKMLPGTGPQQEPSLECLQRLDSLPATQKMQESATVHIAVTGAVMTSEQLIAQQFATGQSIEGDANPSHAAWVPAAVGIEADAALRSPARHTDASADSGAASAAKQVLQGVLADVFSDQQMPVWLAEHLKPEAIPPAAAPKGSSQSAGSPQGAAATLPGLQSASEPHGHGNNGAMGKDAVTQDDNDAAAAEVRPADGANETPGAAVMLSDSKQQPAGSSAGSKASTALPSQLQRRDVALFTEFVLEKLVLGVVQQAAEGTDDADV